MSTALYRHFDKWGALLYVGISVNAAGRLVEHSAGARWFPLIDMVKVEHFPSRKHALAAERAAIETERPIYNTRGNSGVRGQGGKGCWAIYEVETGGADGWYFQYHSLIDIYEFYRTSQPNRSYLIVTKEDPKAAECAKAISERRAIFDGAFRQVAKICT